VRRRWDIDERGHGVADAVAEVPELERLRAAMLEPEWVTEEPDLHLLPHIERASAERGWTVVRADVVDAVLDVEVHAPGVRNPTEAAFLLLGTFAEPATHVATTTHDVGREVGITITTGVLEGDSHFAPHGHVVRLRVLTESSGTA
jgi:uncharacterized protein YihD (DUF1040 family)